MRNAIAGGRNNFGRDESRPYIDRGKKGKGGRIFRLVLFSSSITQTPLYPLKFLSSQHPRFRKAHPWFWLRDSTTA
jgi:hypothetical protein